MTDDPDSSAWRRAPGAGAAPFAPILPPRGDGEERAYVSLAAPGKGRGRALKGRESERARPRDKSALEVELTQPCAQWRRTLPGAARLSVEAARAALAGAPRGRAGPAELGIVLGDDALLRALNKQWRGVDKPTNVLSFPANETKAPRAPGAPLLLGDVVLAFETASREARAQGKPLADHLRHLVVHGVLHLLGFDHEKAAEARRMERLETAVLRRLGVPDPYRSAEAADG